uniref:Uncharacterized protein n=1 Tax=Quercus lobata TaxID=97700 RepID=A0A7N2N1U0_QUELO
MVPSAKPISCLPESNKGLDQDFLIVSGEWHDGLHCPIRDDKHFIAPNFSLVNEEDLNRILRSKIFLHTDGQLCATHDSSPEPSHKGTHQVELPNKCATKEKVISSDLTQEEEAAKVFEVVDSEEEDFEIFDQPHPIESPSNTSKPLPSAQIYSNQEPADIPEAMVLQRAAMSFSSAMYPSGSMQYMVDSRGTPVVLGSTPAVPPSYSQPPFMVSIGGVQSGLNNPGPSRPNFDLNSGFMMEGGHRDSGNLRQLFIPGQGRSVEEHTRTNLQPSSSSGVGGKRKEPDSGWESYPFNYKHQQPPWK